MDQITINAVLVVVIITTFSASWLYLRNLKSGYEADAEKSKAVFDQRGKIIFDLNNQLDSTRAAVPAMLRGLALDDLAQTNATNLLDSLPSIENATKTALQAWQTARDKEDEANETLAHYHEFGLTFESQDEH